MWGRMYRDWDNFPPRKLGLKSILKTASLGNQQPDQVKGEGQVLLRRAGTQYPEDTFQHLTSIAPRATPAIGSATGWVNKRFEHCPLAIGPFHSSRIDTTTPTAIIYEISSGKRRTAHHSQYLCELFNRVTMYLTQGQGVATMALAFRLCA